MTVTSVTLVHRLEMTHIGSFCNQNITFQIRPRHLHWFLSHTLQLLLPQLCYFVIASLSMNYMGMVLVSVYVQPHGNMLFSLIHERRLKCVCVGKLRIVDIVSCHECCLLPAQLWLLHSLVRTNNSSSCHFMYTTMWQTQSITLKINHLC